MGSYPLGILDSSVLVEGLESWAPGLSKQRSVGNKRMDLSPFILASKKEFVDLNSRNLQAESLAVSTSGYKV